MWLGVVLPLIALVVAIPVGWGWGGSALDLSMAVVCYVVTGLAVTVGKATRTRRGGTEPMSGPC